MQLRMPLCWMDSLCFVLFSASCSLHCSYFTSDIFCVDERLQDEAIQQGRTPETLAEEEVKQSIKHSCENLSHAYCCVLGRYIRAVCGVLN